MRSRLKLSCRAAAALLVAATTLSGCGDDPPASSPTAGPRAPGGAVRGTPLRDPAELVSRNGILRARLVVERRKVEVAGRRLWALTHNDRYMPPTLRIRPGDRVELDFVNRLGPHPVSAAQVAGGLSGIMVVDGLQRYLPPGLRHVTEHVIALKDFQLQGDTVRTQGLHIGAPTHRTVNGQTNPKGR